MGQVLGTVLAWKMRNQPKADFLSGNRTQSGQKIHHKGPGDQMSNALGISENFLVPSIHTRIALTLYCSLSAGPEFHRGW